MSAESFPQTWTARILTAPPLIAPARQYVYPQHIPGEEDAMNRGALLVDIKPAAVANFPAAGNFLATCALGFRDPSLPTNIFPCPHPDHLHGTGWNLQTDRELPFTVDLLTGTHTGGGFTG